jgi:nucleoside-diphosphate-sugar epimerase
LYAKTKVAAEEYILNSDHNVATTILRLGTICGLSPRMRFDLLISDLAIRAVQNQKIEIYKPEAWRPFVHVKDAANAIGLVLESPEGIVDRKIFNVVKENIKKRFLGEIVEKHFPNSTIEYTSDNPDDRDYRVCGKRLTRELGYSCQVSVEEAFLETASAVQKKLFRDPNWAGHSAIPTKELSILISNPQD